MKRMILTIAVGSILLISPAAGFARSPELPDCPQAAQNAQAVKAFKGSSEVAARMKKMEAEGWVPGSYYSVMVSASCGVVGCNQTWLTGRLFTKTPGQVNPQTVSVQAHVVINRTRGEVFSVKLISAG